MIGEARRPIDGTFRTWSDGRKVHLLVRFTGKRLGRGPVSSLMRVCGVMAVKSSNFLIF